MKQQLQHTTAHCALIWIGAILLQVPLPIVHHHSELSAAETRSHIGRFHSDDADLGELPHSEAWHIHFRSVLAPGWADECCGHQSDDPCDLPDWAARHRTDAIRVSTEKPHEFDGASPDSLDSCLTDFASGRECRPLCSHEKCSRQVERSQLGIWIC